MKFNDNFTTKQQGDTLITLGLPPATADCFYDHFGYKNVRDSGIELSEDFFSSTEKYFDKHEGAFPCWSVGRLIAIYELCTGVKFERWSHKGVYNNNLIDDCIEHIKFAVNPDTTINFDFKKSLGQNFLHDENIIDKIVKYSEIDKDTLVIDCKDIRNEIIDEFYIKDNLPNGIKNIKVINDKDTCFKVYSFTTDLSNINFSIFEDNGRIYGDIIFHAKIRAGKDLNIGDVLCYKLNINAPAIETLTIGNNSIALEIHLGSCPKLNELYGPTRDAQDYTVCKNFIKYQLAASGKFAWGATMNISNVR